jgi:Kdo2-lipid IVA lauroyltransferase/acyltransferase
MWIKFKQRLLAGLAFAAAKTSSLLPLPLLHAFGIAVGWGIYWLDIKFSRRICTNIKTAGLAQNRAALKQLIRQNVAETGKSILEALAIWMKSECTVLRWVTHCEGWNHVESALTAKQGIVFLTPHLGCYEITARYYAAKHPITVLYRPPRKSWLTNLVGEGRERSQTKLAPTNLSGVRSLLKALKSGEAVGILPDQVPDLGDGVWASYFDTPAYTMNLVDSLVRSTHAKVLLAYGERLSWGRGFVIHITPLNSGSSPQEINNAIEALVRRKPSQYLWSYQRFKQPKLAREKRKPRASQADT